jgi:hypothetical protein
MNRSDGEGELKQENRTTGGTGGGGEEGAHARQQNRCKTSIDCQPRPAYVASVTVADLSKRKVKHSQARAAGLLRRWMEQEADYDAQVWSRAKRTIEGNRLSSRKRFNG